MNIFEHYLSEIKDCVLRHKKNLSLINLDNLKSVNLEVPPEKFNFDLSCNISLVLGKSNKINPNNLAAQLKILFENEIKNFEIFQQELKDLFDLICQELRKYYKINQN